MQPWRLKTRRYSKCERWPIMDRLLKNYLDELETAGSAKQLCQALVRISSGLDIPTFAYIAIPSTAGRQLRLITNYAAPWRRHFMVASDNNTPSCRTNRPTTAPSRASMAGCATSLSTSICSTTSRRRVRSSKHARSTATPPTTHRTDSTHSRGNTEQHLSQKREVVFQSPLGMPSNLCSLK